MSSPATDWLRLADRLDEIVSFLPSSAALEVLPYAAHPGHFKLIFNRLLDCIYRLQNSAQLQSHLSVPATYDVLRVNLARQIAAFGSSHTLKTTNSLIQLYDQGMLSSATEVMLLEGRRRLALNDQLSLDLDAAYLAIRNDNVAESTLQLARQAVRTADENGWPNRLVQAMLAQGKIHLCLRCDHGMLQIEAAIKVMTYACRTVTTSRSHAFLSGTIDTILESDAYHHLGQAYSLRGTGDPQQNLIMATKHFALAMRLSAAQQPTTPIPSALDDHHRRLTMIAGNALLSLRQLALGDDAEAETPLRTALRSLKMDLAEATLRHRTPALNVEDYAYSANAVAWSLLDIPRDEVSAGAARARASTLANEIIGFRARLRPQLVGDAYHIAATLARNEASDLLHQAMLAAMDSNRPLAYETVHVTEPSFQRRQLLAQAISHDAAALQITRLGPVSHNNARIAECIISACDTIGEYEQILRVISELRADEIDSLPLKGKRSLFSTIGWAHANHNNWAEAAVAYQRAVELANVGYTCATHELSRAHNYLVYDRVYRWASIATAMSAQPQGSTATLQEAMLLLEQGRGRELRSRMVIAGAGGRQTAMTLQGDADLPRALTDAMASSPSFSLIATASDLLSATSPTWPLVYLNPTMFGISVLAMTHAPILAESTCVHLLVPFYHARQAFLDSLALHEGLNATEWRWSTAARALHDYTSSLGPRLGPKLVELLDILRRQHGKTVDGLTVVLCGHLAGAPLSALQWTQRGQKCLRDIINIRYAPSAFMMSESLRRAAQADASIRSNGPSLLAMGNETCYAHLEDAEDHIAQVEGANLASTMLVSVSAPTTDPVPALISAHAQVSPLTPEDAIPSDPVPSRGSVLASVPASGPKSTLERTSGHAARVALAQVPVPSLLRAITPTDAVPGPASPPERTPVLVSVAPLAEFEDEGPSSGSSAPTDTRRARPLRAVLAECDEIATLFPLSLRAVMHDSDATLDTLRSLFPSASHLVLSAHGDGTWARRGTSGVHLADHFLPAYQVPVELSPTSAASAPASSSLPAAKAMKNPPVPPRLAHLSLCLAEGHHFPQPDEPLSLPTSFMVAGVPTVIGSLWQVGDITACLFSVKFFDLHIRENLDPPISLARAQRWLRFFQLPGDEEMYGRHPSLRRVVEQGFGRGPWVDDMPFADAIHWGTWVCVGT